MVRRAHGGLGRAGCERAPRTAKQMEGGQVAGRASAETGPLPCSPRGALASLSHLASASPFLPLLIFSLLFFTPPSRASFISSLVSKKQSTK